MALGSSTDLSLEVRADARPARLRLQLPRTGWIAGSGILLLLGLTGVAIQIVPSWRHLYLAQNLGQTFLPPLSHGHILGTDNLGRDMLWRLVGGLGVSLGIGVSVSVLSIVLGLAAGVFSAFFGRAADVCSNVVIDVTWAFPAVLLAVVFAGIFGPSLITVVLALAVTGWASFARIVRGEVLSLREREFVAAARVLGVPRVAIGVRHLVRNLIPVTIVLSVFFISTSIIGEAGLSFIGLGVQDPTPSLGLILSEARQYVTVTWWPVLLAGGLLVVVVFYLNSLGDHLRDRFDPHRHGQR
ncbi:MAG: ABC transporter permease [Streptosporangiaceae bacterium]